MKKLLLHLFRLVQHVAPRSRRLSDFHRYDRAIADHPYFNRSSKPYVRWWWLKGPFLESDMSKQLDWLQNNGFGGVEIAWIAPSWLGRHNPPPEWLSEEWTRMVVLASRLAEERGLGCDFTFGSCWPFGGTRVLAEYSMTREFYSAFTEICHSVGAYSRVQCHGSPTDLLASYGAVDVPESEALLFNPPFSRIPASAAALSNRPVVSSETFTCIYGFSHLRDPELARLWKKEDVHDLRLLVDSIIAHGVNQIVWHGMPYNPHEGKSEFYASVHLGPDCGFCESLNSFNRYMTDLCGVMQKGKPFSQVAVYLPNEDNWMAGRIPKEERTPGASHRWQMRHVMVPRETEGYHPDQYASKCFD